MAFPASKDPRRRARRAVARRVLATGLLLTGGLPELLLPGCSSGRIEWHDEALPALLDARVGSGEDPLGDAGEPLGALDADASRTATGLSHDSLSNEALLALLPQWKYRGVGFRRVNEQPFPSTVSPEKSVVLWVSETGYDELTRVSPEQAGSRARLPVGSTIAREVFSGGELESITLMARLPDGAFPLGGDWWYASASAEGQIKSDPTTGAPLVGLLESCGTCHLRRSTDDHLFGVPDTYLP